MSGGKVRIGNDFFDIKQGRILEAFDKDGNTLIKIDDSGSLSMVGLSELIIDNIKIDENTISSTAGNVIITPVAGGAIVLDGHHSIDGHVITGITNNDTVLTAFAGKAIAIEGVKIDGKVITEVEDLTVDNINIDGNAITSIAGDITVTPVSGSAIVLDGHHSVDDNVITGITDKDTVLTAYAGKAIDIEGVKIDGKVITDVENLTVDNLNIDGNAVTSTTGNVEITPVAGSAIVLDGHHSVDDNVITGITDKDTVFTAYAGKAIDVEGVKFDGKVVTDVENFTVDNINIDGNAITSIAGNVDITPVAGSAIVFDGHHSVDDNVITGITNKDTVLTAYAGKAVDVEGVKFDGKVITDVENLTIDNINIDGNDITSTTGDINLTPVAGGAIVLDGHHSVDDNVITGITDKDTVLTAYVGKAIDVEGVKFDGKVITDVENFTVDNINIDGNAITSTAGNVDITPVAGSAIVLDGHHSVDGHVITGITDNNTEIVPYAGKALILDGHHSIDDNVITGVTDKDTVLTAYAGKAIDVEGVKFDGKIITDAEKLLVETVEYGTVIDADGNYKVEIQGGDIVTYSRVSSAWVEISRIQDDGETTVNGLSTIRGSVSVDDDGTISMPVDVTGFLNVWVTDEFIQCYVASDGTVTLINGSANVDNADTDDRLCVYQSTTQAIIKNRLGSAKVVRYFYNYS